MEGTWGRLFARRYRFGWCLCWRVELFMFVGFMLDVVRTWGRGLGVLVEECVREG